MSMRIILFFLFILQIYNLKEKTDKGIIIVLEDKENAPKKVRLEAINDNIIRVSATAEDDFNDHESLIIVDQEKKTSFEILEDDEIIQLSTKNIFANILKTTGEVWFTDKKDKIILKEQTGGGKKFTPYTCEQIHADGKPEVYNGWMTHQIFESPDDEAFYGLGQHQADEWNYKGKNEELFQYNTKVSIPFIVSSKNYGLLFDTYSLCRFGNPLPYSDLK